jgi:hypothetical protein
LNHHDDTNVVFLEASEDRLQMKQAMLAQQEKCKAGQRTIQTALHTVFAQIQIPTATITYQIRNFPHFYIPNDMKPLYHRQFTKYIASNLTGAISNDDVWTSYSTGSNHLIDYMLRNENFHHMSPLEYFSNVSKVPLSMGTYPFLTGHPQENTHSQ